MELLPHERATAFEQVEAIRIAPDFQLHRELAEDAATVVID